MAWLRSFIRRHRLLVGAGVVVVIGLTAFVLVWFQPQKLFLDDNVSEAVPAAVADVSTVPPPPATTKAPPPMHAAATPRASTSNRTVLVSRSSFISRGHDTSGTALLYRLSDGSHLLRLENLDTSNGPDLRVYLSPQSPNAPNDKLNDGALNIAHLKGNHGSQNYAIAAGVDVSGFHSVVIWCKRFSYAFGTASIN